MSLVRVRRARMSPLLHRQHREIFMFFVRTARCGRWGLVLGVVLATIAVEGVVVLAAWWGERASLKAALKGFTSIPPDTEHPWMKFDIKGVSGPPAVPAATAEVADSDLVIGVTTKGQARAYTINALSDRRQHIVNDVVGSVPVSVAYCDMTQCVRAYTMAGESQPLDVEQRGYWDDKGMILKIKGVDYFHKTGEPMVPGPGVAAFPYQEYPCVRTTWKEWKQQHPGTDVYVGEPRNQLTSGGKAVPSNGVSDASARGSSARPRAGSLGKSEISDAIPPGP
jgi:hypothetical protein